MARTAGGDGATRRGRREAAGPESPQVPLAKRCNERLGQPARILEQLLERSDLERARVGQHPEIAVRCSCEAQVAGRVDEHEPRPAPVPGGVLCYRQGKQMVQPQLLEVGPDEELFPTSMATDHTRTPSPLNLSAAAPHRMRPECYGAVEHRETVAAGRRGSRLGVSAGLRHADAAVNGTSTLP